METKGLKDAIGHPTVWHRDSVVAGGLTDISRAKYMPLAVYILHKSL